MLQGLYTFLWEENFHGKGKDQTWHIITLGLYHATFVGHPSKYYDQNHTWTPIQNRGKNSYVICLNCDWNIVPFLSWSQKFPLVVNNLSQKNSLHCFISNSTCVGWTQLVMQWLPLHHIYLDPSTSKPITVLFNHLNA